MNKKVKFEKEFQITLFVSIGSVIATAWGFSRIALILIIVAVVVYIYGIKKHGWKSK